MMHLKEIDWNLGLAAREYPADGPADYVLFVGRRLLSVIEAATHSIRDKNRISLVFKGN